MGARTSYTRATAGYDEQFERRLVEAITTAIFDASRCSDAMTPSSAPIRCGVDRLPQQACTRAGEDPAVGGPSKKKQPQPRDAAIFLRAPGT